MSQSQSHMKDPIVLASRGFLGGNLLHGGDHLRQGLEGVGMVILVGGAVVTAAALTMVVIAVSRAPWAATAAILVGAGSGLLVSASHLAPHWSVLSYSYVDDVRVDFVSWAVVIAEIAAALVLGYIGLQRARSRPRSNVRV